MAATTDQKITKTLFDYDLYINGRIVTYDTGEVFIERDLIDYDSGEPDQYYRVKDSDRLSAIAYDFYNGLTKNAGQYWKFIADANNIQNPLDLSEYVGIDILIPDFQRIKIVE